MCGDDGDRIHRAKRRRVTGSLQGSVQKGTAMRTGSEKPAGAESSSGDSGGEAGVSQSVTPFLTEHLPNQYGNGGSWEKGKMSTSASVGTGYCYRHHPARRQPSEPSMDQLQEDLQSLSQNDQQAIAHVWTLFSAAPSKHRTLMLQGILSQCCFPQLSFLLTHVRELIKIDFLAALPTELGFQILRHLDTVSLCKAAQVSRRWRAMADDDVVWHRMCEQHIARKCTKCGWGLPLLEQKRLMAAKKSIRLQERAHAKESAPTIQESAIVKKDWENMVSLEQVLPGGQIRPWKEVYRDRFLIGSNWKHGRYTAKTFEGHTNGVMCLQFNDHVLATGSYDSTIKIWDIATETETRTLRGHSRGVRTLQFDDSKLVSGSLDNTIKVWNWHTGECLRTITGPVNGHTEGVLAVHLVGPILASGSVDNTVRIWNFGGGSASTLRGHTDWVNSVKVDAASRTVFSASDDLTVRLWDLDTGKTLRTFRGHVAQVQAVLPRPEDFDYEDEADQSDSGAEDASPPPADSPAPRDFTADFTAAERPLPPRYMLSAALDGTIRLWDVHTGHCLRVRFGHLEGIWAIAADSMHVVSGAQDCMVKVWDARSGKCERTISWHSRPVTCIALNDSRIASGSEDGTVKMLSFNYFRRASKLLEHDCST